MSLEARIETLTAAVVALTEALNKQQSPAALAPDAVPPSKPGRKPKATAAPKPAKEEVAPEPEPGISYEDVSAAVLKTVEVAGRDATIGVLKSFGAGKASELKPEQYGDALAKLKAAQDAAADADLAA